MRLRWKLGVGPVASPRLPFLARGHVPRNGVGGAGATEELARLTRFVNIS